jgi:hypothetical protein
MDNLVSRFCIKPKGISIRTMDIFSHSPYAIGQTVKKNIRVKYSRVYDKSYTKSYTLANGKSVFIECVEIDGKQLEIPITYYPTSKQLRLSGGLAESTLSEYVREFEKKNGIVLSNLSQANKLRRKEQDKQKKLRLELKNDNSGIKEVHYCKNKDCTFCKEKTYIYEGIGCYAYFSKEEYEKYLLLKNKEEKAVFFLNKLIKPKQYITPSELAKVIGVKAKDESTAISILKKKIKIKYSSDLANRIDREKANTKSNSKLRIQYHIENGLREKTNRSDKANTNTRIRNLVGQTIYSDYWK